MFDIELPEVFTGDDGQDFRQWIRRFEVAVEVVPDASSRMHVLLPSRLAGSAFTVWESMPQSRQNDFHEVKKILSAMFGRSGSPNAFQTFSNANQHRQFDHVNRSINSDVFPAARIGHDHSRTSHPPREERAPFAADTSNVCDVLRQILLRLEKVEGKLEELKQQHRQPQLLPSSPRSHPHSESSTSPGLQTHQPKLQVLPGSSMRVCSVSLHSTPLPTSASTGTQTPVHEDLLHSHPAFDLPGDLQATILHHQKEDEEIGQITRILAHNLKPTPREIYRHPPRMRRYLWQLPRFKVHDGILCRMKMDNRTSSVTFQPVIPAGLVPDVLPIIHSHPTSGHLTPDQTINRARNKMFWPFMHRDVTLFCQTCTTCPCNSTSIHHNVGLLSSQSTGTFPPFQMVDSRCHKKKARCKLNKSQYKKRSKYSSQDLIWRKRNSLNPVQSERKRQKTTTHPLFTSESHPSFQSPLFSPLSRCHPTSWMRDLGTFNLDALIQSEGSTPDRSTTNSEGFSTPDDVIYPRWKDKPQRTP